MSTREQTFAAGLAWVIVVERENLDPDHRGEPGITEVYGPFTEAEAEAEIQSDSTPILFDPLEDRINCLDMYLLPMILPNWLD